MDNPQGSKGYGYGYPFMDPLTMQNQMMYQHMAQVPRRPRPVTIKYVCKYCNRTYSQPPESCKGCGAHDYEKVMT